MDQGFLLRSVFCSHRSLAPGAASLLCCCVSRTSMCATCVAGCAGDAWRWRRTSKVCARTSVDVSESVLGGWDGIKGLARLGWHTARAALAFQQTVHCAGVSVRSSCAYSMWRTFTRAVLLLDALTLQSQQSHCKSMKTLTFQQYSVQYIHSVYCIIRRSVTAKRTYAGFSVSYAVCPPRIVSGSPSQVRRWGRDYRSSFSSLFCLMCW